MAKSSQTKPSKKTTRKKAATARTLKFEIVTETTGTVSDLWLKVRSQLGPFFEASREALGDVYSSLAKTVLEKKEDLEDHRAQLKAYNRELARQQREHQASSHAPRLEAGPHLGKRARAAKKA